MGRHDNQSLLALRGIMLGNAWWCRCERAH